MLKTFLMTVAAGTLAASPAFARDAERVVASAAAAPAAVGSMQVTTASPKTRYCTVQSITGSRIPLRTCKTRDRWLLDDGFDPLEKK